LAAPGQPSAADTCNTADPGPVKQRGQLLEALLARLPQRALRAYWRRFPSSTAIGQRRTVADDGSELSGEAYRQWLVSLDMQVNTASILREARKYIDSLPDADKPWLAYQLAATMDLAQADIVMATHIYEVKHFPAPTTAMITSTDIESVRQENLNRLLTTATQKGIARLSPGQVFLVVLVWMLVGGLGVIQPALSLEAQSALNGDVGYVALGLTITTILMQKRK
jgi:hypothetical protein